jgi:hypothetical protein
MSENQKTDPWKTGMNPSQSYASRRVTSAIAPCESAGPAKVVAAVATGSAPSWRPITDAPKDRAILAAWGSVASGAMGYDIVKHKYGEIWESENSGDKLPANGFSIIAWLPLPPLPNDQDEPQARKKTL